MDSLPLHIVETRNCLHCGSSFGLTRRQVRKNKIYCSKKCAAQVNGKTRIKNRCNCLTCGKEFLAYTKKNGRRKLFCSPECRAIGKGILKNCSYCQKDFKTYDKRQYCSLECYYADNEVTLLDLVCKNCQKEFQRDAAQVLRVDKDPLRDVFCSKDCAWDFNKGKNSPLYLGNRSADRGYSWTKQRKKALDSALGHCYFCNDESEGKKACVDHIIPFRLFYQIEDEGDTANDLVNLWVLCRSCHARKTQIEINILYSDLVDFEEFVRRVHDISSNENTISRIRAARQHWMIALSKNAELVD